MFSKNVLLKAKSVYVGRNDEKFSMEVAIKSNHTLDVNVLRVLEEDIKRINIPNGYKLEVKDKD